MDIQVEKKISQSNLPTSNMLAKKALLEMEKYGKISVTCPKCQESPIITTTARGERTTIVCKCGYVFKEEINL